MNATHIHLVAVHVPVVGAFFALAVLGIGMILEDRRFMLTGTAFTLVCAAAAVVAYTTGPMAFRSLGTSFDPETAAIAVQHGVIARAAFMAMALAGLIAIQVLLRSGGGEPLSKWAVRALMVTLIISAGLISWAAHLGGTIRHPEARGAAWDQKELN